MIKTALRASFFMAKLQKPESNGYVNHTVVAHIWSGTCGHSLRSLGKFLIISNPIECTINKKVMHLSPGMEQSAKLCLCIFSWDIKLLAPMSPYLYIQLRTKLRNSLTSFLGEYYLLPSTSHILYFVMKRYTMNHACLCWAPTYPIFV